jgi:hypothetical protein
VLQIDANDYELFRVQAIAAVGLAGHPKANALYALAWEYGWEGGSDEVLNCLADLAEMELEGK